MATLPMILYRYRVVDGEVTAVDGLQTLEVEDKNNDGLIDQKELREYFPGKGNGKLRGTMGPEDRDVEFSVAPTGNTKVLDLYTVKPNLQIGDKFDVSVLEQNFPPFSPQSCVPCFASDTLIETERGLVEAGNLAEGDMVRTRDAGFQPVRWIGQRTLTAPALLAAPNLHPIRIRAGALGADTPSTDLVVSPQHRILIRSGIAQKMFAAPEVLVAAKQLLQIDGIDIANDLTEITYVHFLFDDHQIVFSNGAETESLHTGTEALKSVGAAAREEIFAIFPELRDGDVERVGARMLTSGRLGRRLAVRHAENRKPLVS